MPRWPSTLSALIIVMAASVGQGTALCEKPPFPLYLCAILENNYIFFSI